MTTYHVRLNDGQYYGERDRAVRNVNDALIYSREGAIHAATQMRGQAVMLTSTGQVRMIHDARPSVCGLCGQPKPVGQSCLCFDNNCS